MDEKSMADFVNEKIVYPFSKAIEKSDNKVVTQNAIEDLFAFDFGNLTNEELRTNVNNLLNNIFPDDLEMQRTIKIALGIEYEDETGTHYSSTKNRYNILDILGGEYSYDDNGNFKVDKEAQGISFDELKKLNQKQ
jgi:hypothetical protein